MTGAPPWPSRGFREEFLRNFSKFIRDDDGKFQSLGSDSAISSDTRRSFATCIISHINDYMDSPPSRGPIFRRYRVQGPNDEPYIPVRVTGHVTNNPIANLPQDGLIAGGTRGWGRQLHTNLAPYSECNQHSFTIPCRKNDIQQIQSRTQAFRASNPGFLDPGEPPSAGSGSRAAGNGATSIDSHLESTSRRRNREASPPNQSSSTIAIASRPNKRADTRAVDKSKFPLVCEICGDRFKFPARLKTHMETASHTSMRYSCEICSGEFTRNSSLVRHQNGACRGARQADGASTLGSSSGARIALHTSAGGPSRTPHSSQRDILLADSSTGPAPGNWQPLVPVFYPSSTTLNPRTASRRNSAHAPSQPQDVANPPSPPNRRLLAGSSTNPAPGNWLPLVPGSFPTSPTDPQNTSRRNSAHIPLQSWDTVSTHPQLSRPHEPIDPMMLDDLTKSPYINWSPSP